MSNLTNPSEQAFCLIQVEVDSIPFGHHAATLYPTNASVPGAGLGVGRFSGKNWPWPGLIGLC